MSARPVQITNNWSPNVYQLQRRIDSDDPNALYQKAQVFLSTALAPSRSCLAVLARDVDRLAVSLDASNHVQQWPHSTPAVNNQL
jgi:hypothetical protein